MNGIDVYFSDFFCVDEDIIENYGAVNISLINDMPLFIDPFLLFNSDVPEYQRIHREMIDYLRFLQEQSQLISALSTGMRKAWFSFSEVKQTWLGFSQTGNSGRGMGAAFADGLFEGLSTIFRDFSNCNITRSPHMEKLCLISTHIGRDKISDFTANFVKRYLLEYTEAFAKEYLSAEKCRVCAVKKAKFNWQTYTWETRSYYLPFYKNDFVLLTPKRMLTKDNTFINRDDMLHRLQDIAIAIPNDALRFELNQYLSGVLVDGRKPTKEEMNKQAESFIRLHPEIIDYYMKYKEDHEEDATAISKENVESVQYLFIQQASALIETLKQIGFYSVMPDAYDEAMKRLLYLKHVIEDQDGYRFFYDLSGKPIKRESDLQLLYRLVWYGTTKDVNREVNNGRGPVDYKVSVGKADSVLVEFKLASNSKLRRNLENQVSVYKAASETNRAMIVIMLFTDSEAKKVNKALNDLELMDCPDIVLIDARNNKVSASNVK